MGLDYFLVILRLPLPERRAYHVAFTPSIQARPGMG